MAKRSYGQFCPTAYSLDLLGDRWTLLILRELAAGSRRFTDLRDDLAGIAPNLLTDRLRSLTAADLVTTRELPPPAARTVYELTGRGAALRPVLHELARWGLDLLGAPGPDEHLPAAAVPDGLRAMVRLEELPDYGVTIGFGLTEGTYLMTVAPRAARGERLTALDRVAVAPAPELPGDAPAVRSSLPALMWLRTGTSTATELAAQGLLSVTGSASAVRDVAHMWGVDPTALAAAVAQPDGPRSAGAGATGPDAADPHNAEPEGSQTL